MMNQAERRAFVETHRTCIFAFQRRHGPPSMSVVYYVLDGNDLLISTMAARAKAKAVARTREAAVCVLDEQWPLTYLQLYGPAVVQDDLATTVDVMMKVAAIMSGQPLPEVVRPMVEAKAREERRVVIRLQPQWTVYSPPVHLYAGDDGSTLQHGLAERMAWIA
jgi:PPOX class probable F420-dependent enzyme